MVVDSLSEEMLAPMTVEDCSEELERLTFPSSPGARLGFTGFDLEVDMNRN